MPGLVPGIHVLADHRSSKTWMAGSSPAMVQLLIDRPASESHSLK